MPQARIKPAIQATKTYTLERRSINIIMVKGLKIGKWQGPLRGPDCELLAAGHLEFSS
jgi:hypothetical protein